MFNHETNWRSRPEPGFEVVEGRIIVRGRCDSHHVRQLAWAAMLEAFEALEPQSDTIERAIEVG